MIAHAPPLAALAWREIMELLPLFPHVTGDFILMRPSDWPGLARRLKRLAGQRGAR